MSKRHGRPEQAPGRADVHDGPWMYHLGCGPFLTGPTPDAKGPRDGERSAAAVPPMRVRILQLLGCHPADPEECRR